MGFLLIIVFVLFVLTRISKMAQEGTLNGPSQCKLHDWQYDSTGFLICKKCKNRPGYEGRGPGGYEG